MLVDGQPFQVKCGASPQIVQEHFAKYPDIPVYVNSELAPHFADNPLVHSTSISREFVLQETTKTLHHAAELTDFDIPWITAVVSAYSEAKRVRRDNVNLTTAVRNVVTTTASRGAMGMVGQVIIGGVGAVLFPGAGGIVAPVIGAYAGVMQGGKVAALVKKQFAKSEYNALCTALWQLLARMQQILAYKHDSKVERWATLQQHIPQPVRFTFTRHYNDRITVLENVVKELQAIDKTIEADALTAFERLVHALSKASIHVFTVRNELAAVETAFKAYKRKL